MGSTFYSKRYKPDSGRNRKLRPKTFKTRDAANKSAESDGIKEFYIEQLKEDKFRVSALSASQR